MRVRAFCLSLLAAGVLFFPAGASQPEGLAGKLISNPPIAPVPDPNGLPDLGCTGFGWARSFGSRPLDPTDTVTFEMAIVPFRSGFTDVIVSNLMQLRFADGLVDGLPYRRSGWNDVRAVMRPGTRDYMLTLNGTQAGPFPMEIPCAADGTCLTLEALTIRGLVREEAVAWVDSLSLVHDSATTGSNLVFELAFDKCFSAGGNLPLGGMLMEVPPAKLGSGGTR